MSTNEPEKKKQEEKREEKKEETKPARVIPVVPVKDTEQLNEGVDPKKWQNKTD